jgi:hypothetical protein
LNLTLKIFASLGLSVGVLYAINEYAQSHWGLIRGRERP